MKQNRIKTVSESEFRELFRNKKIRPASLYDVSGTHHTRPLYKHPKTGQFFVQVTKPATAGTRD